MHASHAQIDEAEARAEQMLHEERVRSDRILSRLLLVHFPVAVGLGALHGDWTLAIIAGAVLAGVPARSSAPGPGASRRG